MYGLKEGDSRIGLLKFLEPKTKPEEFKLYIKFPESTLTAHILQETKKPQPAATAATPAAPTAAIRHGKMIANSTDTEKAIRQMLSKNPSLRQYDTFRNGVKSLCVAYRDTPAELVAALMRQRMDIDVLEQLELLTHVMVEVPLKEPAEAKDLLDMPFRDSADAGSAKASLHMRMATPTEKGDPTTGSVAVDVHCRRYHDQDGGSGEGPLGGRRTHDAPDRLASGHPGMGHADLRRRGGRQGAPVLAAVDVLRPRGGPGGPDALAGGGGQKNRLPHPRDDRPHGLGEGGHLSLLLMHKISTSKKLAECASLLFGDGTREWTVIKDRARTHAARLRVEALSATAAPTPAFGVQQRGREGGSGAGKSKGPGAGGRRRSKSRNKGGDGDGNKGKGAASGGIGSPKCGRCGRGDHTTADCKLAADTVCYNCDGTGHLRRACRKPQKALLAMQVGDDAARAHATALAVSGAAPAYAIVDPGASVNCVTAGWLSQHGDGVARHPTGGPPIVFQTAGATVESRTQVELHVMWLQRPRPMRFHVLETASACPPLIGIATLKRDAVDVKFRGPGEGTVLTSSVLGERMEAQTMNGVMTTPVYTSQHQASACVGRMVPVGPTPAPSPPRRHDPPAVHPDMEQAVDAALALGVTLEDGEEAASPHADVAELQGAAAHRGLLAGLTPTEIGGVVKDIHASLAHPGVAATAETMKSLGLTPPHMTGSGFRSIVAWAVRQCATCASVKPRAGGHVRYHPASLKGGAFNESLSMDLAQYHTSARGRGWALTIVDDASQYKQAAALNNKEPAEALRGFLTAWVGHFGRPGRVRVDGGGEFQGAFAAFCKRMGIAMMITPVSHHASNGRAEGWHPRLHAAIRAIAKDTGREFNSDWDLILPDAVAALNRRSPVNGGFSPAARVLQLGLRAPALPEGKGGGEGEGQQQQQAERDARYTQGQRVMYTNPDVTRSKSADPYQPAEVEKVVSRSTFLLRLASGRPVFAHANHMKPAPALSLAASGEGGAGTGTGAGGRAGDSPPGGGLRSILRKRGAARTGPRSVSFTDPKTSDEDHQLKASPSPADGAPTYPGDPPPADVPTDAAWRRGEMVLVEWESQPGKTYLARVLSYNKGRGQLRVHAWGASQKRSAPGGPGGRGWPPTATRTASSLPSALRGGAGPRRCC